LPIYKNIDGNIDNNKTNIDRLINICNNNLKNTDLLSSTRFLQMLQNSDYGFATAGPTQIVEYSINNLYDHINNIIDNNNKSEEARRHNQIFQEDFIQYAHLKNNI
jgi:hypothetical protein